MTRVKICGLTNRDDIEAACTYGADAVGFIFVPGGPRYIGGDLQAARGLLQTVPPLVWRVGVYDAPPEGFAVPPELHAVQYYASGVSAPKGEAAPVPIKAFRVQNEDSLRAIETDPDPKKLVLLDAYSPNALGGTGHTFNWDLAVRAKSLGYPIVLAGGLTPENVGEAVRTVRPYMVDVSSGVETEPGRKDHDKIKRFIRAVREADLATQRTASTNTSFP